MDVEELLDGLANLRLVRGRMHLERVLAVLDQAVALLGDDRREQHLVRMEAHEDALLSTSSRAASVTSSERAQTTCATSSSDGTVTSTRSTLRNDLISASSPSSATTTSGNCCDQPPRSSSACFVDGSSKPASTNASVPAATWAESAERRAAFWAFLFTLTEKSRGVGGNATPPPVNCGARIVPARARPVPFWRHGFARPPASSVTCLPAFPALSRSGALGAATVRVLPDLDEAVLRARHRALEYEQVLLGLDAVHGEADLRDALATHPAGHAHPLEDARGRGGRTHRPPLADVVRAVAHRAPAEVVPLDRAREALADPGARDLDPVARRERLDRDRLAGSELAAPTQLDEPAVRLDLVLLQVTELTLGELPLGDLVERELHRVVAVLGLGPHGDDRARARLDHGHRGHRARLRVEDLRHTELLAEDAFHRSRA